MTPIIFKNPAWAFAKYDARKKAFRGITRQQFEAAKEKHFSRTPYRWWLMRDKSNDIAIAKHNLWLFEQLPYAEEYAGNYDEDYHAYKRPSSNGRAFVAIAPAERGNNYYTDHPLSVKILMRKYNEWLTLHK